MSEKEIGFNKLAQKLDTEEKVRFSRPTLSEHLRHLEERNLIVRRKEEKSNLVMKPVFYSLNFRNLNEYLPISNNHLESRAGWFDHSWFEIFQSYLNQVDNGNWNKAARQIVFSIMAFDLSSLVTALESLTENSEEVRSIESNRIVIGIMIDLLTSKLVRTALGSKADKEVLIGVIEAFSQEIFSAEELFSVKLSQQEIDRALQVIREERQKK